MRFAVSMPNFGAYGDVALLVELARDAEATGWDALFLWDHIAFPVAADFVDPWLALTAIALRTERLRFGPMVTPLPRRRPWKVARETVTLDCLSGGRLIFGVGSGIHREEFDRLGEEPDLKTRAAMLDEGLAVLTGLWSGEPFTFQGEHYAVDGAHFRPPPVQRPRPPIWVAGTWPRRKPLQRAARWDGYVPDNPGPGPFTPADVRAMVAAIAAEDPAGVAVPYMLSGGTDNKAFDRLGVAGYGFSPMRLPADLDFTALFHGVDERIPVEALRFGTRVLDRLIRSC
jgi:alkanesulfonate monooxygenase SsuD/methylene tetrahydromethanopterin reductase-like flavin-dependent oxidoreductase (luciferase family)